MEVIYQLCIWLFRQLQNQVTTLFYHSPSRPHPLLDDETLWLMLYWNQVTLTPNCLALPNTLLVVSSPQMFVELNGIPWIISFITIYLKAGERGTMNWWDPWLPSMLCNPFHCFKSKEKNVTHDRNIKRSLYLPIIIMSIIIIFSTYYYIFFSLKHIITGNFLSFNLFWPPFNDGAEFYCMDLILFSVFNTFPKYFRFWFHSHLSLSYRANPFFLSIPSTYHMLDLGSEQWRLKERNEQSSGCPEEQALWSRAASEARLLCSGTLAERREL